MDLAKGDERSSGVAGDGLGQQAAIAEDGGAVVLCGKAEIELARCVFCAVGAGPTSDTRTESAPKPGKVPTGNGQPLNSVGSAMGNWAARGQLFRGETIKTRGALRPGVAELWPARTATEPCLFKEGIERGDF